MKTISARLESNLSNQQKYILIGICATCISILLSWGFYSYLPDGSHNDWALSFRPAVLKMFSGGSPYQIDTGGVFNPPWILALLGPLAFLPERIGWALLSLVNLYAFGFTAYRLGAKPVSTILLLLSTAFLHLITQGQIDGLIVLGFFLPRPIGLFLLLGKPQIGIGVAIFWLVEVFREKGLRRVVWTFLPVGLAYAISIIIYGPYMLSGQNSVGSFWDYSIWPLGIPIGLILLKTALVKRKLNPAILTGPFLSPYVGFHSYSAAMLGLVESPAEMLLASLGTWIIFFLGG